MSKRKKIYRWLFIVPVVIIILAANFLLKTITPKENIVEKSELRTIAVMPFQNLTGNAEFDHWALSFQDLLINKLASSRELTVRQHETMFDILKSTGYLELTDVDPGVAREIGEILHTKTVIHGSIHKAGQEVRIITNLLDPASDNVFNTYELNGNMDEGFFAMVDSLSNMIKNFLEIKVYEQDMKADARDLEYTNSSEAYNYFVQGTRAFFDVDATAAVSAFKKAIEIDTSFTLAQHFLAVTYLSQNMNEEGEYWLLKADKNRENLPLKIQLYIDRFKAKLDKDEHAVIEYLKQITDVDPYYRIAWYDLGMNYNMTGQYEQGLFTLKKAMEVNESYSGGDWNWPYVYTSLGEAYYHLNEHEVAEQVYERGLSVLPDHPLILYNYCVLNLSDNKDSEAEYLIEKYRAIRESDESWTEADILNRLGDMYYEANRYKEAEEFYRSAVDADPQDLNMMNRLAWFLINTETNIDEGISLNDKLMQFDPDDYFFLETCGMGKLKAGKSEEALAILKKAWELRPDYKHSHYLYIEEAREAAEQIN